jgi:hypothetical protein
MSFSLVGWLVKYLRDCLLPVAAAAAAAVLTCVLRVV